MSARAVLARDIHRGLQALEQRPARTNATAAVVCLPLDRHSPALTECCRRDWANLQRYAAMLLGDRTAAEDVLQEVFLQLLQAKATADRVRNRRAWLFRVVRNACLRELRRQHRQAEIEMPFEPRGAIVNPEISYQRRRLACELIGRLTPRELACVRLRAEGFSYAEIARSLDIRLGTVGAFLNRATAKCRSLVAEVPAPQNGSAGRTLLRGRRPLQAASTGTGSLA